MLVGVGMGVSRTGGGRAQTQLLATNLFARWRSDAAYTDTACTTPAANGENVMGLLDLTLNGRHAVRAIADATRPTLVSNVSPPYVAANGTAQQMQMPASITPTRQNISVVFIGRLNDLATGRSIIDTGSNQLDLFTASGHVTLYKGSYQSTGIIPTTSGISVFTYVSGPTFVRVSVNGVMYSASLLATSNAAAAGGNLFKNPASGGYFRDRFYEAAVYNTALSVAQVRQIEAYAAARYGVTLVTPTHNLVFKGDSRTQAGISGNVEATPSWVVHNASHQRLQVYNLGVASQPLSTMVTNGATEVDTLLASGLTNILVFQGGGNDIISGDSDATVWGRHQTYANARRTAGWNKVIVANMLPRTDATAAAASYNTHRNAINALLAADHSFADGFIDVAAVSGIGADTDPDSLTNYLSDKAHQNDAGHVLGAAAYTTVVNTFL